MNKEIISNRQGICVIIIYTLGSSMIMAPWRGAGKDSWISIIIAMVMITPMLFVYARLVSIFPGKDFFDLQEQVFGKIIGKINSFFLVFFSIHLAILVNRNTSEFIQIMNFPETPIYFISLIIGILAIWIVKAGIEVIGRFASFVLPLVLILVAALTMLLIPKIVIDNLKPILYNGFTPVIGGAISAFGFPFAETFLLSFVFSSLKNKNKVFKIYFLSTIITGILFIIVSTRNTLVLGEWIDLAYYFPAYTAAGIINIKEFITRLEVITGINYILFGFVKQSICLYISCIGFSKLFNISDYRQIVAPVGLMVSIVTIFVYKSTIEMFEWASENYMYYSIPFTVILPLITLIIAGIQVRKLKHQ